MEVLTYYYKYCRNSHMVYSPYGEVAQRYCEVCGQPLIDSCESCGAKLRNTFQSRHLSTSIRPIFFPMKSSYCNHCGAALPWAKQNQKGKLPEGFWETLHPSVVKVAKSRFESGHYADAVEAALKELNAIIKEIYRQRTGEELDGVNLMRKAFSPSHPVIVLGDLATETGRNIQQGYMDIFAGAIAGIRNPKAHDNIEIDEIRAVHHLFVVSLLFSKLDEKLSSGSDNSLHTDSKPDSDVP